MLQIFPRLNVIVHGRGAGFDGGHIELEDFMNEPLFALEIVIELTFAGSGNLNDFVWARSTDTLFVKQIGCSMNDPESCLGSLRGLGGHKAPSYSCTY